MSQATRLSIESALAVVLALFVAMLFLVIWCGNMLESVMTFSQRKAKHSDIRHAVNLHIERAARDFGAHSCKMLSSCSAESDAACPDLIG